MTWHLCGVNGPRWRSGMSKFTVCSSVVSCALPDVWQVWTAVRLVFLLRFLPVDTMYLCHTHCTYREINNFPSCASSLAWCYIIGQVALNAVKFLKLPSPTTSHPRGCEYTADKVTVCCVFVCSALTAYNQYNLYSHSSALLGRHLPLYYSLLCHCKPCMNFIVTSYLCLYTNNTNTRTLRNLGQLFNVYCDGIALRTVIHLCLEMWPRIGCQCSELHVL
jgi:hypothetical protein